MSAALQVHYSRATRDLSCCLIPREMIGIHIPQPQVQKRKAGESNECYAKCAPCGLLVMTLIYRERISPVFRPVNRGWQGKALCLFRGDFVQSAKIRFNPLLSVFGILFVRGKQAMCQRIWDIQYRACNLE